FCVYHLVEPFISLWLGPQYILDQSVLILLMVSTFILLTRGAVDMFNAGYGNYGDLWAAWVELAICLTVTVLTAPKWGVIGILLGKIFSLIPIGMIWKPMYLYKAGFQLPFKSYWKSIFFYYCAFGVSFALVHYVTRWIPIDPAVDFMHLIGYSVIISFLFLLTYTGLLYGLTDGAKLLVNRMIHLILR
ncbi:MAG: sugar transporter, partial [bacterium]|nr:sugar transporter [bacterium]